VRYSPVFEPYDHQREALEALAGREAFALFMSQRTGKTKVIIDEWGQAVCSGDMDALLVVAPGGAYRIWEDEIEKHLPAEIPRTVRVWVSRTCNEEVTKIVDCPGPKILIVNVEALSTIQAVVNLCRLFLQSNRATMVVDESTTIKGPTSIRTRVTCTLGPWAKRRRILSGLPDPQSPLDYYAQMWFLDPKILGFSSYEAFTDRHAVRKTIPVGKRRISITVGYQNIEEIKIKISKHMFRRTLKDCYDLPPKIYSRRDVDLTDEQKRIYLDLKTRAMSELESGDYVSASLVIVQMLRLHQVCCGHVKDENNVIHSIPSNKIKVLLELLEEYDGKAVVWCSYAHDLAVVAAALRKRYGDDSVSTFWGGNVSTREDESRQFQEEPSRRWMVATPGAGGRGRTWPMANMMVYYSNTDNLEHREQSEERGSIVGKTEPVVVVDLIARGTVEEKIVRSLQSKIDMSTAILGGEWKKWIE